MTTDRSLPPVLLIEDDPVTVLAIRREIERLQLRNPLEALADGDAAVARLEELQRAGALPALVMLDRELPGRSGMEVLRWMSTSGGLGGVPVIVLTATADAEAIAEAHRLGARSYLVKPVGIAALGEILSSLDAPWALLPSAA